MQPFPNIQSYFTRNNRIVKPWIQYIQQFTQAPPKILDVTVGTSPFSYTANEPGNVSISGGIVSGIGLVRGTVTIILTGQPLIPVSINDIVIITYSGLPTVKFIPAYGANTQ